MFRLCWMVLMVLFATRVERQVDPMEACSTIVQRALTSLNLACASMERNSVCYGHNHVNATFTEPQARNSFTQPGDRAGIATLQTVQTSPFDPATGQWGLALMKLQVDAPQVLPGQALTFLLMGDVKLESDAAERPTQVVSMRVLRLQTGVDALQCEAVPTSSLVVQGPEGAVTNFEINGAAFEIGSTVVFRTVTNEDRSQSRMGVWVLNGHLVADGVLMSAGYKAVVDLDESGNVDSSTWSVPLPMDEGDLASFGLLTEIPVSVLPASSDMLEISEKELR
jgi:hypothetical protein